jgi:hypothetical protein
MLELTNGLFVDLSKAIIIECLDDNHKDFNEGRADYYQSKHFPAGNDFHRGSSGKILVYGKRVLVLFEGSDKVQVFEGDNGNIIRAWMDQHKR